jgi:hypothetical protein
MLKKILICAVIALVLVPASVMAAGFGGKSTGTATGQGQCLQDGQNCMNQTGQQGSGSMAQFRNGMQQDGAKGTLCTSDGQNCASQGGQNKSGAMAQYRSGIQQGGAKGTPGTGNGLCTGAQNQTRSMLRLHDGSGTACKTTT